MKPIKHAALLSIAVALIAQARGQSLDWHAVQHLNTGTKIHVTLKHGRIFGHCFFDGATEKELMCRFHQSYALRVYERDNIKAVYLAHSGPWIGFGVGAATGAVVGAAREPVPGLGRGGTALVDAGIMGGVGAFVGPIADPFFHGKAIYQNSSTVPQQPKSAGNTLYQDGDAEKKEIPCLRDGVTLRCVVSKNEPIEPQPPASER